MHKKLAYIKCLLTAIFLLASLSSYADIQTGVDAYEAGDYATALKEFKPLAEQGDAVAQYNLGMMYRKGQGVSKDGKESAKWYRKAAEQGMERGGWAGCK